MFRLHEASPTFNIEILTGMYDISKSIIQCIQVFEFRKRMGINLTRIIRKWQIVSVFHYTLIESPFNLQCYRNDHYNVIVRSIWFFFEAITIKRLLFSKVKSNNFNNHFDDIIKLPLVETFYFENLVNARALRANYDLKWKRSHTSAPWTLDPCKEGPSKPVINSLWLSSTVPTDEGRLKRPLAAPQPSTW